MGKLLLFFFSSRRRHTRFDCDWSSDVCSSNLAWLVFRSAQYQRWVPLKAKNKGVHAPGGTGVGGGEYPVSVSAFDPRSEERRVGKECRSGWSAHHQREKQARWMEEQERANMVH